MLTYKIKSDNVTIYNPQAQADDIGLSNINLSLAVNEAGTLTFSMPPNHRYYNQVYIFNSIIDVERNGKLIWRGRPINKSMDFSKVIDFECEGVLAWLNDVYIPNEYSRSLVRDLNGWIRNILTAYNENKDETHKIYIGNISYTDSSFTLRPHSYITCFDLLSQVIAEFNANCYISFNDGKAYLNAIIENDEDYITTNIKPVRFAINLMDLQQSMDIEGFATVVIPLGAGQIPPGQEEADENYPLTIESVNNGIRYLKNDSAVTAYGWIETVQIWSDVTSPSELKRIGENYLNLILSSYITFDISFIDYSIIDPSMEPVDLLDIILVVSKPHNISISTPLKSISIDLSNPANTKFSISKSVTLDLINMIANNI